MWIKLYQQKKRASYDDVRYTLGWGGDCESGDDGNGNGDSVDDDDDDDVEGDDYDD